uniref:Putative secreted protein n=1 Tax=Anopheles darlingi TaxID=43151 RepID=A0A2M4D252_ANODA
MLAAPPAPLLPFFVVAGRCVPGAEGDAPHGRVHLYFFIFPTRCPAPQKRTTVYGVDVHASSERAARAKDNSVFHRSSRTAAVVTEDSSSFFLAPLWCTCATHTHTFGEGS